jgi:hypothetical protein
MDDQNVTYECNQDLQLILEKQGFIETTSARDKIKGKKEFRTSKTAKSKILFDYINFVFYEGRLGKTAFGTSEVTADELRLFFWYMKSSAADRKEIGSDYFSEAEARTALNAIRTELKFFTENGFKNRRIPKLSRMVDTYEKIQLN